MYLINYHAGVGLLLHAQLGIAMAVLFLLHHILNLGWYRALFRGHYSLRRSILTVTDLLLLVFMTAMLAGAVMISGMVFPFSAIPVKAGWRTVHVAASSLTFLLMAVHLGIHLHGPLGRLDRRWKDSAFEYVWYLLGVVVFAAGCFCLAQSRVPGNLMPEGNPLAYGYSDFIQWAFDGVAMLGICFPIHWLYKAIDITVQ